MSDLIFNSTLGLNGSNFTNQENTITINPIVQFLNSYYTIFIIVVGLIGNTITIIIFWRTKLTHTKKTSFYLISLAFSDIGFLLILLFKYCDDHGVLVTFSKHSIACKLSVYLGYIFNFLSCSLIFTFTLQRLLVICFPLRVNFLNLERGSKLLVILLFCFACLFYSVILFIFDTEYDKTKKAKVCTTKEGFDHHGEQFNFLDSLFTLIIPFFGLLIMNAIIIRTLKKSSYNFIVRTSNNHLTYEPKNSLIVNNKNSENYFNIQEGILVGTGPVINEINKRKKSMIKNKSYYQKSFKKAKEYDYFESESKNLNESLNGSAIISSNKSKKPKKNCLLCNRLKSDFKSNDAIFSTNLINSNNSTPYLSTRQSILMSSIKRNRKESNVKIDDTNEPKLKDTSDSKKNSVELSSLLNKKTDFKARTSFRIGGTKTNSVSRKVTKMLIIVSTTFLILNLPVHSANVYIAVRIILHGENSVSRIELDLREISHYLFYTSFSCNFLLYSISGVTFRTEFKRLVLSLFRIKNIK